MVEKIEHENPVEAAEATVNFVNNSLRNTWRKPEYMLEINEQLSISDIGVLSSLGLNPAHVILYQGWGSCGQYAIVTAYILHQAGYTTRTAKFKDRDHMWAEIRINKTWYILDPWYIGLLKPAHQLAKTYTSQGVLVTYPNGTTTDASKEHGYTG